MQHRKATAGHQPISLTHGFGAHSKIYFVDFKTMSGGNFKFLLNCINQGTKIGSTAVLTSKRASADTQALFAFAIFCFIGHPQQ